jgi:Kef-type K+ transport system membrane component KefB
VERRESLQSSEILLHLLLALFVVLVAARLVGLAFRRLGQPPVIGEVVAGILLGPSLLGRAWPEASSFLLPPEVAPYLQAIAQIGVILYMFVIGLELDPTLLRRRPQVTFAVSITGMVVPFLLGLALAGVLYPTLSGETVQFVPFAVFIGVALSITAFPVLARILSDRGIQHTRLGTVALACAAIGDVIAWCLLALATAIATSRGNQAVRTLLLTGAFLALVLFVVRPLLARLARRAERQGDEPSLESQSVVFATLLLAALATEWIGIHALFGAFLVGVATPHDSSLARALRVRLHDTVAVLLLPAFFAFSGLRTQLGLLTGAGPWSVFFLILVVACVGKFGGTTLAARAVGLPWRSATSLGVLMNTRGLVELIVLNVGLDLGVIGAPLFTMLVLMALVTTFATSPLLSLIERPGSARALRRAGRAVEVTLGVFSGGLVVVLGVLAVFSFIPFLPSTLIAAGVRLIHKARGPRD